MRDDKIVMEYAQVLVYCMRLCQNPIISLLDAGNQWSDEGGKGLVRRNQGILILRCQSILPYRAHPLQGGLSATYDPVCSVCSRLPQCNEISTAQTDNAAKHKSWVRVTERAQAWRCTAMVRG